MCVSSHNFHHSRALYLFTTTDRPGFLDLKGKAKWDAWESRKGKIKHIYWSVFENLLPQLGYFSAIIQQVAL